MNRAISVITVCFNAERTIADTIRSVACQTWREREHLIIDGASRDGTLEIARRVGGDGLYIHSSPDRGAYDAMNKGIRLANGDIIGFLNADDYYADARVLADIAERLADPAVEAVFGDLDYVTGDGAAVVRCWRSRPYRPGAFARGWLPPHPTFYVRRQVLERFGVFDLSYRTAADFDLMNRLFTRGRIRSRHIPRTLVRMRVGGISNASWRAVARAQLENMRSLIATFGMVPPAYPLLKLADRLRQIYRARARNRALAGAVGRAGDPEKGHGLDRGRS